MTKTLEGTYRAGKIELAEPAIELAENTPVFITFTLPPATDADFPELSKEELAAVRTSLAPFMAEWDRPEMSAYDDYDAARRQKNL